LRRNRADDDFSVLHRFAYIIIVDTDVFRAMIIL
jgi:hypothetical protein